MIIRKNGPFEHGYNVITSLEDPDNRTMMDYGALLLNNGQSHTDREQKEKAYLLIQGKARFEWDGHAEEAERNSFLSENPICLHVPADVTVNVTALSDGTEFSVSRTLNEKHFEPKYYPQQECMTVEGGKGLWDEASLRSIRTIFDLSNAPDANLVLGEVVHRPGRWSSFPPHHHPQPELYFYKFYPEQGFGYSEVGDDVFKVRNNDACAILKGDHPQVCAPGYAMYYVWVIRHLENDPFNERIYAQEHKWLLEGGTR